MAFPFRDKKTFPRCGVVSVPGQEARNARYVDGECEGEESYNFKTVEGIILSFGA
jgi:hypothetical protein